MKPHRIVLLGPPASGKGTQGRFMTDRWHVPVVSVGEVLRGEIAANTPLGQEAGRYMNHGRLVPDHVAIASVDGWLETHAAEFVFDGFPRTVGQADALAGVLQRHDAPLTAVIWLEVSLATIEHRVSRRVVCSDCGRAFQVGEQISDRQSICPVCGGALKTRNDDDPATLAVRMEAYRESTEPLMEYYEARGLLRKIDSSRAPEQVFASIESTLGFDTSVETAAIS